MKRGSGLATGLFLLLFGNVVGAWAVEVNAAAVQGVRQTNKAPPARAPEANHPMRDGVVTRVDLAAGKVEIQGHWHSTVGGRTLIYQQGHSARPDALKVGQTIRYSVSEGDSGGKRLEVLYVP